MTSRGPFRSDARVERRAECAPAEAVWELAARAGGSPLELPLYLGAIGLSTAALGAVRGAGMLVALATGVTLCLLGALVLRVIRRSRRAIMARAGALPTHVSFTADAMILESSRGETAWRYGGVRGLRRIDAWLLVELEGNQVLFLRADEDPEPLEPWLARRTSSLAPRRASTRRQLAWLFAAYVALATLATFALP